MLLDHSLYPCLFICLFLKGDLLEGKKHGKGKFTGKGGSIYEGNWVEGLPEGCGTLELNNDKEITWIETITTIGLKTE